MANAEEIFRAEFAADPNGVGYAAQSVEQRMSALNSEFRGYRPLPVSELLAWACDDGRALYLRNAAVNGNDRDGETLSAEAVATAISADRLFTLGSVPLDLSRAETRALLDRLVAANVLTDSDAASLLDVAATVTTRAIELTSGPATVGDVARASMQ